MKRSSLLLVSTLLFSTGAMACNQGFGPGGCVPETPLPPRQAEMCFPDGCAVVTYLQYGNFLLASSSLPNGYAVLGWAGPCYTSDLSFCPDIANQAYADLLTTAHRANRAQYAVPIE